MSGDTKGVGEDGDGKGEGGTFWSERATSGGEPLAALASAGGYDTARVHGGTWQGYSQAKWVAEMLVWAAAKSGGRARLRPPPGEHRAVRGDWRGM